MSGTPPPIVGKVTVRRSDRRPKLSASGAQYRAKMAEQKIKTSLSAKSKLFAEAAILIVTKADPSTCVDKLEQVSNDITEAYQALQAENKHEPVKNTVDTALTEIESMIEFLQKTFAEKQTEMSQHSDHSSIKDQKVDVGKKENDGPNGINNGDNSEQNGDIVGKNEEDDLANKGAAAPLNQPTFSHVGTDPLQSTPLHKLTVKTDHHSHTGQRSAEQPNPLLHLSDSEQGGQNPRGFSNNGPRLQSNLAGSMLLSPGHSDGGLSTSSDVMVARLIQRTRLEVPKPTIFRGDPLKFTSWARSFHALVIQSGLPETELFHYLKGYLGGPALSLIEDLEMQEHPNLYEEAVQKLRSDYGDPNVIAAAYRQKLHQLPHLGNSPSIDKIKEFSNTLESCKSAKTLYSSLQILDYVCELNILVSKLPSHMITRWNRHVNETYRQQGTSPSYALFCDFVKREKEIMTNPLTCPLSTPKPKNEGKKQEKNVSSFGTSASGDNKKGGNSDNKGQGSTGGGSGTQGGGYSEGGREVRAPKCLYCSGDHWLDRCEKILKIDYEARQLYVKSNRICFCCLRKGHIANHCKYRLTCRICKRKHATMFHKEKSENTTNHAVSADSSADQSADASENSASSANTKVSTVSLQNKVISTEKCSMVVPVWLFSADKPENKSLIYAALDTQSDSTFVLTKAVKGLGVSGSPVTLKLSTMGAIEQSVESERVKGLAVQAYGGGDILQLPPAFSRDIMPCDKSHVPSYDKVKDIPHLKFLENKLHTVGDNIEISLLIGYDSPLSLMPLEVVAPPKGIEGPYAIKTVLGWSVVGPIPKNFDFSNCNLSVSYPVTALDTGKLTHHSAFVYKTSIKESVSPLQIKHMFDQDFASDQVSITDMSQDDLEFLSIMKGEVKSEQKRYQAPLPFRGREEPNLPNNHDYAQMRFAKQCQKMSKNETYNADYRAFMKNILDKGYAEEIPKNELKNESESGHVWYLSHHGVYHPRKPTKIRVVFDASAAYRGTALNSHLLIGPDLINPLIGVLCRFRLEAVAVMCDVEQMFFQFHVTPAHRDFLRFLWFSKDGSIGIFRMKSHVFGASSSPSVANFCLKQISEDHKQKYGPEAANFVKNNFYVDDGLVSVATPKAAIDMVQKTKSMLAEGSLVLHKFVSNSQEVMSALSENPEHRVSLPGLEHIERALGVFWSTTNDCFVFSVDIDEKPHTRRGILSVVSSIFDPLGLIAPCILLGKRILQEICHKSVSWDEPLPQELIDKYVTWVNSLQKLDELCIPRCIRPSFLGEKLKAQLHVFADASSQGYGACAYMRLIDDANRVHCSLIFAKSRVLPSKTVSVPRLELNAALLGAKMGFMLRRELGSDCYGGLEEFYWSDSLVAIGYIKNSSKRFHTFVANRVQQIQDLTDKGRWFHVVTLQNPADIASRGLPADDLCKQKMWFEGPAFLYDTCLKKYMICESSVSQADPEVKPTCLHTKAAELFDLKKLECCSTWERVINVVILCLLFTMLYMKLDCMYTNVNVQVSRENLRNKDVHSIECAKKVIYMLLQQRYFGGEIKALKAGNLIQKGSKLYKLKVFLDKKGLLRIGGRLSNSKLDFELKYPIILPSPKESKITALIVAYFHKIVGHQGRRHTINSLRNAGLWVIGSNACISSVLQGCYKCRLLYKTPEGQLMADLPAERVTPSPPFTHTGVDMFGPLFIREGRKNLKRYGVIFVCAASRAVHLEVSTSLSTDAFINCLRRFIALRGTVRFLYCDRGTNFVGADSELQMAVKEMDSSKIKSFLEEKSCDYVHFLPHTPHASHFSGAWERFIRSAKRILAALLLSQGTQLHDEGLRTLFYEITAIINSRPLTLDPTSNDLSVPLSPQNLLTLKSGVVLPPPGEFDPSDLYARKFWRRVQFLADQFWVRWRKEYLSELQARSKWNKVKRDFRRGDVALLQEPNAPRCEWHLCRVEKVYASKADGLIRSVQVRVGDKSLSNRGKRVKAVSLLDRPVHKLILIVPNENLE